jgi:IstB-like ATP binding protein
VNTLELARTLKQLRLSGMADVLDMRLVQAQAENLVHLDFLSTLVGDELLRRQDRLLSKRLKEACFRDVNRTLDRFDFDFKKKMNRKSSSSSRPRASSRNTRTRSSSGRQARARVTARRPSASPPSSRAFADGPRLEGEGHRRGEDLHRQRRQRDQHRADQVVGLRGLRQGPLDGVRGWKFKTGDAVCSAVTFAFAPGK